MCETIYCVKKSVLIIDVSFNRKNIDRRREKFGYESVSNMGLSVAGADVFQVSYNTSIMRVSATWVIPGRI